MNELVQRLFDAWLASEGRGICLDETQRQIARVSFMAGFEIAWKAATASKKAA